MQLRVLRRKNAFWTRRLPPTPISERNGPTTLSHEACARPSGRNTDAVTLGVLFALACTQVPTTLIVLHRLTAACHRCRQDATSGLSRWRRRARERDELIRVANLGDRDLWDLGMTLSDVRAEANKPFWRKPFWER